MSAGKRVCVAAGGTGGHINAALAFGRDCAKSHQVFYMTGQRPLDYRLFKGENAFHLCARPLKGKGKLLTIVNLFLNFLVLIHSLLLFVFKRPAFVFGLGGYVCGPVGLAAFILGIPVYILEQNSVLGVTNRLLAKIAKKVFLNFETTKGAERIPVHKLCISGNPINLDFYELDFSPIKKSPFTFLVFGGSLGATDINILVERLLGLNFNQPIKIYHQLGVGNEWSAPREIKENIEYSKLNYIDDMPQKYQEADLVIARAGASTISELMWVQKPSVLVPLLLHADKHQLYNAEALKEQSSFPCLVLDMQEYLKDQCQFDEFIKDILENRLPIERKETKNFIRPLEIFKTHISELVNW